MAEKGLPVAPRSPCTDGHLAGPCWALGHLQRRAWPPGEASERAGEAGQVGCRPLPTQGARGLVPTASAAVRWAMSGYSPGLGSRSPEGAARLPGSPGGGPSLSMSGRPAHPGRAGWCPLPPAPAPGLCARRDFPASLWPGARGRGMKAWTPPGNTDMDPPQSSKCLLAFDAESKCKARCSKGPLIFKQLSPLRRSVRSSGARGWAMGQDGRQGRGQGDGGWLRGTRGTEEDGVPTHSRGTWEPARTSSVPQRLRP